MDRAKSALEDFELGLFNKVGHANFCARCLAGLPATMAEADSSRMAIGFYCLGALDILGLLETKMKEADREAWRAWIWAQQVRRPPGPGHGSNVKKSASKTGSGIGRDAVPDCNPDGNQDDEDQRWIGGFRPGPFMHIEFGRDESIPKTRTTGASIGSTSTHGEADPPHLIMTYTALLALAILRDDFAQLDREGLVNLLRATQKPDGSFTSFPGQGESDIRMVYTAFAISAMLNDWSGVDVPLAVDFTKRCMSYEGGFGQVPENEAQGGSTYCALATLALAPEQHRTEATLSAQERKRTERWLVQQQKPRTIFIRYESDDSEDDDELERSLKENHSGGRKKLDQEVKKERKRKEIVEEEGGGFSGRTEKVEDACYSFWCGAALRILRSGLVGSGGGRSSQLQLHSRSHLDTKSSASSNVVKRHLQREETEDDDDEGDFVDRLTHARFLSHCQFRLGGLAKAPGAHPDPYHTYLALAALALYPPPQLPPPHQNPNQPFSRSSTSNPADAPDVGIIEPSDTELLNEMKAERRKKERESWRIAQLDPLINATVETSRWARERIPRPGKQR